MRTSIGMECRACGSELLPWCMIYKAPHSVQTPLKQDQLNDDKGQDLSIMQCVRCGLVQLRDDPDFSTVYSEDYWFSVSFSAYSRSYQLELAERWDKKLGLQGKSVLELGGGDGFFAELLTKRGCIVTMVEPAARACQAARRRGIHRVINGYLDKNTLQNQQFDFVVLRHVLEHVARPRELIRLLRGYLVPRSGKLLVEVPNLDAILSSGRFCDFYAEHVLYFSPGTLVNLAESCGMRVLETYTIERGDYLVIVAEPGAISASTAQDEIDHLREKFRDLVKQSRRTGRTVGIYGAGGRGVALLSLVDAASLGLSYVVDSDPRKWGRFTPGTHLPIVSPQVLRDKPVDDLLISALSFQEEIAKDLAWFAVKGRRLGILFPHPRWIVGSNVAQALRGR